jgi:hypothetical protein
MLDDPGGLTYAPNLIIGLDSDIRRGNSQKGLATERWDLLAALDIFSSNPAV